MERDLICGVSNRRNQPSGPTVNRRAFLGVSALPIVSIAAPGMLSPANADPATFDRSLVRQLARDLAGKPYKAADDKFGEQGVMDLIAVNGYYVMVSMILNVDRTPLPGGAKPPLPVLK